MVESAVTPTTVMTVSRSWCGPFGSTAAMARAADAPQIATAPPVSTPKAGSSFAARASSQPTQIVAATAPTVSVSAPAPSDCIWSNVMRIPSSATPRRSTPREAKSMPGRQRASAERKLTAMPSSRANSITGAP